MLTLSPQYIKDKKGKNSFVILPKDDYEKLIEKLEDAEDNRFIEIMSGNKQSFTEASAVFKRIREKKLIKNNS